MARSVFDGARRAFEFLRFLIEHEQVCAVVRQHHAVFADEERAVLPLRDLPFRPDLRLLRALIPMMRHRREIAAPAVGPRGAHVRGRDLRMRRRAVAFDGQRMIELQGPERQVVRVAAQIAHRAVGKAPVAIPARAGEIDVVDTDASARDRSTRSQSRSGGTGIPSVGILSM